MVHASGEFIGFQIGCSPEAPSSESPSEKVSPVPPRRISLRIPLTVLATALLSPLIQPVLAQAPANDVVAWPSGLLLLATVLYAALGTAPDSLWDIEPTIGFFLFTGLPRVSISTMQNVPWSAPACHFVSGIRSAFGQSNSWVRAEEVSPLARAEALRKVTSLLNCVTYKPSQISIDESEWRVTSAGLLEPAGASSMVSSPGEKYADYSSPSARDFLLFAAIDYHVFRTYEVQVQVKGSTVFSTKGMAPSAVIDVDSEEMAAHVVAAQLVRRPHSQSLLRGLARRLTDNDHGPYILDLGSVPQNVPICYVDFHSYAPDNAKVSASLDELAGAYYRVVRHIKRSSDGTLPAPGLGLIADVNVGQCLWIAILGGAILDSGRLTIQNLPGKWGMKGVSADEGYLTRLEAILQAIEPHANTPSFFDIVFSGGISRRHAMPFLLAGLFGQVTVCYFLAVGTSAGVWTSVALANSLYAGKLTDWHSLYYGKTLISEEPGMKMYVPGSKQLMVIATFNRSTPRQGGLRPGILLNTCGLVAAIFGAVFQHQTRNALGFADFVPARPWVVYTSIVLTLGVSMLIAMTATMQQLQEKTWSQGSQLPLRWMIYSTLPSAVVVAALGALFRAKALLGFWPVLDAITWLSGIPYGMIENGRIPAGDDNMLHLLLVNRWLMGAVASAVGSSQP